MIAVDFLPIVGDNGERSIGILPNFFRIGVELNINVGIPDDFISQVLSHRLVKPTKEQVSPVHESDFGTQTIHDLSKFQGNKASTYNYHTFGLFLQIKDLIRSNRVFRTRNVRLKGPSSRSDDHVLGMQCLRVSIRRLDDNLVLSIQTSISFNDFNTGILQDEILIHIVQSCDFRILVFHEFFPIKFSRRRTLPSIT